MIDVLGIETNINDEVLFNDKERKCFSLGVVSNIFTNHDGFEQIRVKVGEQIISTFHNSFIKIHNKKITHCENPHSDFFGEEVNIGDNVAVYDEGFINSRVHIGKVKSKTKDKMRVLCVRTDMHNHKRILLANSQQIFKIDFIKEEFPEVFI